MINIIVSIILSFSLGLITREIIRFIKWRRLEKQKREYTKVKPLNQQDFKKAMKDLEIK